MLHYVSFAVSDLTTSGRFYDAALGALGYRRVFEDDTAIGYGVEDDKDMFCIKLRSPAVAPGDGFYLAFAATTRAAVDEFHAAALKSVATITGNPVFVSTTETTITRPFSSIRTGTTSRQ